MAENVNMLRIIFFFVFMTVTSSFSHPLGCRTIVGRSCGDGSYCASMVSEVDQSTSSHQFHSFVTNRRGIFCRRTTHSFLSMSSSSSSPSSSSSSSSSPSRNNNNYGPPILQANGAIDAGNAKTISQTFLKEDEEMFTMMPTSPALSFKKFVTMQEKRIVVAISYSEGSGLRPYFLTAAQRIKAAYPDVIIVKRIVPFSEQDFSSSSSSTLFEVRVDDKVVPMGGAGGSGRNNNNDEQQGRAMFVSMEELGLAIAKARKKKRPTTMYRKRIVDETTNINDNRDRSSGKMTTRAVRLEMLKKTMMSDKQ